MTKRFFIFIALVTVLCSCTTAKKSCPTSIDAVTVEENYPVIEEDIIVEKVPEVKGDDQNKLILDDEEETVLVKEYFPVKYNLKENEYTEVSLLPGSLAEFSFTTSQERGWRILIRNDDPLLRQDGFYVDYFITSADQPNIFVFVGGQDVKKKTNFLYQSEKNIILKIVIKNDSDHLVLPLTFFPAQYNLKPKLQAMEVPQR